MAKNKAGATRRGFTLMEMAVALVIVGLMTGLVLQTQHATKPNTCYTETQAQLNSVRGAMEKFMRKNNRLPFPAGRSYGVTDTQFGRETTGGASAADIDNNGGILYGALPFQALGLPSSFATDCWGNKLSYAVTQAMTNANSITDVATNGNITIKSGTLGTFTTVMNNAVYAVISHGQDAVGAVAKNYKNTTNHGWCAAVNSVEQANCSTTYGALYSTAFNNGKNAGAVFFDDVLIYGGKPNANCNNVPTSPTWTVSGVTCAATISSPVANGDSVALSDTVTDTTPTISGAATFTCTNGTFTQNTTPVATCTQRIDGVCGSANGGSFTTAPTSGLCTTGTASAVTGAYSWSCAGSGGGTTAACAATQIPTTCTTATLTWGGGCSASFATINSGQTSGATANTAGGYTGSATAPCTSGSWGAATGTCSLIPVPCSAQTLSWGGNCSGNFGATGNGGTSTTNNTVAGYTGAASALCNNGTWNPASGSCAPIPAACAATTLNWAPGCTGAFAGVASGGSSTATNTAGSYTGTASATCTNGAWGTASGTCTIIAATNCNADSGYTWYGSIVSPTSYNGICNASLPALNNGQSATLDACISSAYDGDQGGVQGEITVTCNNGVLDYPSGSHPPHGGLCIHSNCFISDVAITMEDGTSKPISDLKVGDRVKGHGGINTVQALPVVTDGRPIYGFNGGEAIVTAGHPFFTQDGWKAIDPKQTPIEGHGLKVGTLNVGDRLTLVDGTQLLLRSIDKTQSGRHALYNPVVTGDHTYFANRMLVHNKQGNIDCGGAPPPSGPPCNETFLHWGSGSFFCNGDFPTTPSGSSATAQNVVSGETGTATATCNNGTWGPASGTCTFGQPAPTSTCDTSAISSGRCTAFGTGSIPDGGGGCWTGLDSGDNPIGTICATCHNGSLDVDPANSPGCS